MLKKIAFLVGIVLFFTLSTSALAKPAGKNHSWQILDVYGNNTYTNSPDLIEITGFNPRHAHVSSREYEEFAIVALIRGEQFYKVLATYNGGVISPTQTEFLEDGFGRLVGALNIYVLNTNSSGTFELKEQGEQKAHIFISRSN